MEEGSEKERGKQVAMSRREGESATRRDGDGSG